MDARALSRGSTAALLLLLAAACSRPEPFAPSAVQAGGDAPDPGYRAAPELRALIRAADGAVSLSGRAIPSSRVLMVSPAGVRIETTADGHGVWTAPLGPVSEPTLYRMAAETGGQTVEAEGYVAVLPGAPTVALLRAGAGAVVQDAGQAEVRILAVDIDSGGAAVVSGRARASAPVRVMVDGALAIEGAAGADGRFSLTLPKPLAKGPRKMQALTPKASAAEANVDVAAPTPPSDGPYQAVVEPAGWRLDWLTPGGGPQTTLLIGAAAPQE